MTTRRALWVLLMTTTLVACQTPPPAPTPTPSTTEPRVAALKQLGFVPQADTWELSLGVKLLFATDVDHLTAEGRNALASMAHTLREVGIDRIQVVGHTDNVGGARYNKRLSMRRADSVARELIRSGMPERSIERLGFGFDKPVADNNTAEGRAQNRRVVITVRAD